MKSNCKTMTRESASVVTQQGLWLTLPLKSLLMDGLHFILGSSTCGEWLWWRPLKNVHSSAQHQGGQKNDSTFCRWTHSCNIFQPKAENTPTSKSFHIIGTISMLSWMKNPQMHLEPHKLVLHSILENRSCHASAWHPCTLLFSKMQPLFLLAPWLSFIFSL